MKRASEEMLMFVRDVRVIYQSVLFGGFSSDEAVVGDSELPADTCLVSFPPQNGSCFASVSSFILPVFGCAIL